jgi:hypothetical protein
MVISALVGGAHISFYQQYGAAGMNKSIPIASTTFGVGNEHKLISAEEGNGILAAYSYFQEVDTPDNPTSSSASRRSSGRCALSQRARHALLRGHHALGRSGQEGRHRRADGGDRGARKRLEPQRRPQRPHRHRAQDPPRHLRTSISPN